ncbi:MAG: hypothetical protein GXX96_24965 [Planctomycetaceae bacterium]|nr:hypothetical protein [Planctomycetaceae bacterium]
MARPVRVEFENAVYHVTARGNERKDIYRDPADRQRFLETLEEAVGRFGLVVHAYCLLGNHYHLLLQTPRAKLTGAAGWLQTTYSIRFNRRPGCVPSGSAISAAPEKRPRRPTATRSPRCSAKWPCVSVQTTRQHPSSSQSPARKIPPACIPVSDLSVNSCSKQLPLQIHPSKHRPTSYAETALISVDQRRSAFRPSSSSMQ